MKLNSLSKWSAVFKPDGKPRHKKPKKNVAVGFSLNPSSAENKPQGPQILKTQDEPVSPEPVAASTTEPIALNAQPGLLSLNNSTPQEDDAVTAQSLWNRAYDGLKHKEEKLVDQYEELLSRELPPNMGTQKSDEMNNRIDNKNLEYRQEQLKTIASNGLKQMEEGKTKYIILGHEFVPRDRIAKAAQFVQSMKSLVDAAVRVSPEASLAWAGVCMILPFLTDPVAAEEANRDGFAYVTSRMRFYAELQHLLWPGSLNLAAELRREFEDRLVHLYQHMLEFQVRTVLRFYQTRPTRLAVVEREVWKGMLSKIQELESIFDRDLKKISDASSRTELENLNRKIDSFLADMGQILSALEADSKPAISSFNNYDSGHQFNVTGGHQNNNVGSGKQFLGDINGQTLHIA